ncbi:MAG: glycine oxidase ThiO [Pyrinomonadaceae bacterium]
MSSVLIIGGGVIGLTIAREFHKKGIADITILEREKIGKGASFAAAGMLAPQAEADEADDFFRFCDESRKLYPKLADELYDETGIDIELDQTGTIFAAFHESDSIAIAQRFSWQKKAGMEVERLSAAETHKLEPFISPDSLESLFFPNDWQIENRNLLNGLKKYAEINGLRIFENTEVSNLTVGSGRISSVETKNDTQFSADIILISSGAWTSLINFENRKLAVPEVKPIRGQMLSFQTAKRLFRHVIYSRRGYIVPRKNGKILAGATVEDAGFENTNTAAGTEKILTTTSELSPSVAGLPIADRWSGLRPFTADGFPLIGRSEEADNLYLATAHYRNGILLAPMTASIVVDKIVSNAGSKYLEIYSPNRLSSATNQ